MVTDSAGAVVTSEPPGIKVRARSCGSGGSLPVHNDGLKRPFPSPTAFPTRSSLRLVRRSPALVRCFPRAGRPFVLAVGSISRGRQGRASFGAGCQRVWSMDGLFALLVRAEGNGQRSGTLPAQSAICKSAGCQSTVDVQIHGGSCAGGIRDPTQAAVHSRRKATHESRCNSLRCRCQSDRHAG